jgi:hypothetical protein
VYEYIYEMKITQKQWDIIDAPVKARLECSCKPVCKDCLDAMYESQRLHTYYTNYNKKVLANQANNTLQSKSLMWYEVTFTFPDKDLNRAKRAIERLKKYSNYKYIDGRFELGKGGLYHMHFLIKTNKYLRNRAIRKINDQKITHLSRLRGRDGLKFQNYIEKDVAKEVPEGWDISFSE